MKYDLVIVGGGLVGLTLACSLAKSSLKIAVIEASTAKPLDLSSSFDLRVSAINRASQNIFQHLHVWDEIKNTRITPYAFMEVWDAGGDGRIRFAAQSLGEASLGHIIENSVMHHALLQKVKHNYHIDLLCPKKITKLQLDTDLVSIQLDDGETIQTNLIVGADGAHSWLRKAAQFECEQTPYNHHAIVTTVTTDKPHQHTAYQRFLATGPLAFLPLPDAYHCSIVWSTLPSEAETLMALSDEEFKQQLTQAFEHRLGNITAIEKRLSFPLIKRHVKSYVKDRVALIGDAAHTIHPLAGQGVNLGFLDAATLAEVLQTAVTKHQDIGQLRVLRRYERWRRGDISLMLAAMDGIKALFMNEQSLISLVRNKGLSLVNQCEPVKKLFIERAMGLIGDLPALAK